MKLITHDLFSLGLVLYLSQFFSFAPQFTLVFYLMLLWIAYGVNHIIDKFGHTWKETQYGYIPTRTGLTHSVFHAPIWGGAVGGISAYVVLLLANLQSTQFIVVCTALGALVAMGHLFLDSFTQAGVFYRGKRIAIAHWRYNNPFGNLLFIVIGIYLLYLASPVLMSVFTQVLQLGGGYLPGGSGYSPAPGSG